MSLPEHTTDADDLPPSAKYVAFALEAADGSLPRSELQEQTALADTTLTEALDRLESHDVIRRDRRNGDLRFVHVEMAEIS